MGCPIILLFRSRPLGKPIIEHREGSQCYAIRLIMSVLILCLLHRTFGDMESCDSCAQIKPAPALMACSGTSRMERWIGKIERNLGTYTSCRHHFNVRSREASTASTELCVPREFRDSAKPTVFSPLAIMIRHYTGELPGIAAANA